MEHTVDVVKAMDQMTFKVKLIRVKEMRFRIWIGVLLIRLAALILNADIDFINSDPEVKND